MNKKILNQFGEIMISEVRDEAIEKFEKIASGRIKSVTAKEIQAKLQLFSSDQIKIMREIIVNSIDDAVHNFLWMIEQHDELEVTLGEGEFSIKENINKLSDGLSGEIYTEDGWIAAYSKYKENY